MVFFITLDKIIGMKFLRIILVLLSPFIATSQISKSEHIKKSIEIFFEGFHKGDTLLMKSVMLDKFTTQTAFKNKAGEDILVTEDSSKLLNAIANKPADQKWDERLLSFNIKVDGNMANAWVDYEFWFNNTFSHCGVNSFQLFNKDGKWKIIYLIDTRRRKDCGK